MTGDRWKKTSKVDDFRKVVVREIAYKSEMDKIPLLDSDELRDDLGMDEQEVMDMLDHIQWWCGIVGRPLGDAAHLRTVGDVVEYAKTHSKGVL